MDNTPNTGFWDKNFILPLKKVIFRFPISIAIFTIIAGILSGQILNYISYSKDINILLFCLWIAGILSITGQLFREKFQNNISYLVYPTIILYATGFYFYGITLLEKNIFLFVMQIFAFLAFPFWISYSYSEKTEFRYYNFFRGIFSAIILGFAIAIILGILWSIAITSIRELFGILDYKYIGIWWTISIFVFGVTYGLSRFPVYHETEENNYLIDTVSTFVMRFVFIPFVTIYFLILYAYSAKVLLHFWDWPKGIIAIMVMAFSILGYFTYIFTKGLENFAFIKLFRSILPFAILFQLPMLFYAIYLRINQYGLTTNRYIIVLFGIILLGLSLHFILGNRKRLVAIPMGFSFFALIFSIGPWNVNALPETLQFEKFKKNIETLGLFKNGEFIQFDQGTGDKKIAYQISDQIDYLCSRANDCYILKRYFEGKIPTTDNWGTPLNYWGVRNILKKSMGVGFGSYDSDWVFEQAENENDYMLVHLINYSMNFWIIDVSEYDYIVDARNAEFTAMDDYGVMQQLTIREKNIGTLSMNNVLKKMVQEANFSKSHNTVQGNVDILFENDDFIVKIIPEELKIHYRDDDDFYYYRGLDNGKILIKDKNGKLSQ